MATFFDKGSSGVNDFARRRKCKLSGYLTLHTFHRGDASHEAVMDWIDDLELRASAYGHRKGLLHLVRDALEFHALKRPNAQEVSARLLYLACRTTYDVIMERFKPEWNVRVQYERFSIWAQAVSIQIGRWSAGFAKAVRKLILKKYRIS